MWTNLGFSCEFLGWTRVFHVGFGGGPNSNEANACIPIHVGTPMDHMVGEGVFFFLVLTWEVRADSAGMQI